MLENFESWSYFVSPVYVAKKPEFLNDIKIVCDEYYNKHVEEFGVDEIYPLVQTENFNYDDRVSDLASYIAQSSWEILDSQGYSMQDLQTTVGDLWYHVHHKYSSMDVHTHGFGSQLSGFYFLECPENCSDIMIHDPRPAKIQVELSQKEDSGINVSNKFVWFKPEPGMLFIANSWLPHSFSRNSNTEPLKFLHFNIYTSPVFRQTGECPIVI